MDIGYYSFAFYIFLLAGALIWFNARVKRGGKKRDEGSFEKEQRLFKLYQNVEDMLNSFEEYAEDTKSEIKQSLEKMNENLSNENTGVSAQVSESLPKENTEKKIEKEKTQRKTAKPVQEVKLPAEERIPQLIKQGMDKNGIARELNISAREVSLIMGIKNIETDHGGR